MTDTPRGFVALRSLTQGPPDPAQALAEIRRIYFKTTRTTIEHDLAHAIELLKSIESEEARDKAAVYMDGLSQMRSEWAAEKPGGPGTGPRTRASNTRRARKARPAGRTGT